MSKCVECGREMDRFEAEEFMECFYCRRAGNGGERVRRLYDTPKPKRGYGNGMQKIVVPKELRRPKR